MTARMENKEKEESTLDCAVSERIFISSCCYLPGDFSSLAGEHLVSLTPNYDLKIHERKEQLV